MIGWNQEKSHFSNTGKILLLKQEFSDGLNIHEHKECYYTFDNSLLFTEGIQNTTQIFINHNVQFLPCQHQGVGIMQYVYALNPVCIVLIIPDTPTGSPSGLWT